MKRRSSTASQSDHWKEDWSGHYSYLRSLEEATIPTISPLPHAPPGGLGGAKLGPAPPTFAPLMSPDTPMSPRGRLGGMDTAGPFCPDRLSDCPPIGSAMMTTIGMGGFGPQDRPDFGLEYGHGQGHGHMLIGGGGGGPGEPNGHGDLPRLDHHESLIMNRLDREPGLGLDRFDRGGLMSERVAGDISHYMDQAQPPHAHFGHMGHHNHHHPHLHGPSSAIHERLMASPPLPDHRHPQNNNSSNNKNNTSNNNNNNNTNNNNNNNHNHNNTDIHHENNRFERLDGHQDSCISGNGGVTSGQDFGNGNILGVRTDSNMNVKQCPISGPPRPLMGTHDVGADCSEMKGDCKGYSPFSLLQDRSNLEHHSVSLDTHWLLHFCQSLSPLLLLVA